MMGSSESKSSSKNSSSFREGYWADDQDPKKDSYKGKYPWPVASSFTEKDAFLAKLTEVEQHLQKLEKSKKRDDEDFVIHYRGLSKCRICKIHNGAKEYVLKFSKFAKVNWPEGFRHYVEAHEIKPSERFVEIIMAAQIN